MGVATFIGVGLLTAMQVTTMWNVEQFASPLIGFYEVFLIRGGSIYGYLFSNLLSALVLNFLSVGIALGMLAAFGFATKAMI